MDSLGKILIASNDSNFRASMVNNLLDQFKAHSIEVLSTEAIFRKIEKEKIIINLAKLRKSVLYFYFMCLKKRS